MKYNNVMNKLDYDKMMREQAEQNKGKKLLLHCCCAPCASACLEKLKDYFKITTLFYNPNIEKEEYDRRKAELLKLLDETGWADFLDCDYDGEKFFDAARGLENEPEGGARCRECFGMRIGKTAELAREGGFDFFTTSLTLSPLKNTAHINEIGKMAGGERWLYSDFKKRDGYLRSIELSKQFNLYRQNYCGCEFSKRVEQE